MIAGGRVSVRAVLSMATLTAIRHDPAMVFYRRLFTGGRPANIALTAATHELVTIFNAILHDRRPWQPA